MNYSVILLSDPITKPIQGESGPENLQHNPETKFESKNYQNNCDNFKTNQGHNIKN